MKTIYFKNLELVINSGELIGVIGPNGCGKTILLKMISGRIKNDNIFFDDKSINDYSLDYKKNNIVCVFDDNIYNTNNVKDELKYYLNKINLNKDSIDSKLEDFIDYFNLEYIINENFINLGTENRIYIKILSLLIINPCLFCIDDLLTYLNMDKKIKILNYIKENNITLLNVTSNMEELMLLDKVLVMNKGKKEFFDLVKDILCNEERIKELGLSLPFIYDINSMLKSYDLIKENHIVYKELVNMLWK